MLLTPCSKIEYFSFRDKYNLISLAKIQMLTLYAKMGGRIMLKMTRGGYRMNTAIKIHLLQYYLSHNYQKMCKFNRIIKINVTENVIHCTSCENLHFVCINLRITILDSDTNVNLIW